MATRLRVSPSTIAYMERKLACVEEKRSHPPDAAHIARILAEMQSTDDCVRAQAVREVCPCRMPWDVYAQVRKAALRLRNDPSLLVRANALHVEEDAREIAALELLCERIAEHEEGVAEASYGRGRCDKRRRSWRYTSKID